MTGAQLEIQLVAVATKAGLVRHESGGEWALTPRGLAEASRRWGGAEP